ncbi:hypothetical protein D3C81_1526830 [compost metagenome]
MQHALHGVRNRFFIRLVSQQQHEFIAALARHGIAFAQAGGQALRGDLEQFIANLVPEAVIDECELVEVEEGNRGQLAVAFGMQDRLLHAIVEQGAIRQAGQRIVRGLELDFRFMQFAFGDGFDRTFEKQQGAIAVVDRTGVFRNPDDFAVTPVYT